MKVVVVGAGSVGAHIGYRLAARGADVVVVDAAEPAGGTSSTSIAWLSSFPQWSWTEDAGRAAMRRGIHQRFRELHSELGGDWLHWSGTLTWVAPDDRDDLVAAFRTCRDLGLPLELLGPVEVRRLAPQLTLHADDLAVWEEGSGWVDAPVLVRLLLGRMARLGGSLLTGCPVVEVLTRSERVTGVRMGDGTVIDADVVVNAAGSWASHVAALAGVAMPLDLVPGVMVYTAPQPIDDLPGCVVDAPEWVARPDPSGGLAIHWRGEPMSAVHGRNGVSVTEIIADVARSVPRLAGTAGARSRVGIRPIPPGGPVVGRLPWLPGFYVAVSHGGIGWGPLWADAAARELLDGTLLPELTGLRPERFYLQNGSSDADSPCR